MQSATKRVHFGNYTFDICAEVYEPAEDSFLFAENLSVPTDAEVLDVGTGSGLLAVLAAQTAKHVLAIDINPYAIRCAKVNAARNHMQGKICFLQADLVAVLDERARFDLVLFNAPYLPSEERLERGKEGYGNPDCQCQGPSLPGRRLSDYSPQRSAVPCNRSAGGKSGREVMDHFILQVPAHLKADGRVLLMQSTLTGVEETISRFKEQQLRASVKAEHKLPFFETLTLIEAKR
jgi:release factor glutamine methyltransferase